MTDKPELLPSITKEEIHSAIKKAWYTNKPNTFGEAMDFATDEIYSPIEAAAKK